MRGRQRRDVKGKEVRGRRRGGRGKERKGRREYDSCLRRGSWRLVWLEREVWEGWCGGNGRCGAVLEGCGDGKRRCGEENAGAGAKKAKRRQKEGEWESGETGFGVWGSDLRVGFPRLGLDASYCGVSCITSGRGGLWGCPMAYIPLQAGLWG